MIGPEIDVLVTSTNWSDALPNVEALCRGVVAVGLGAAAGSPVGLPADRLEVSLVLSDDAEVRELNGRYRGQDKPTNVLSFPAYDAATPLPPVGRVMLGDVIVAFGTATAEAAAERKSLADHLSHLLVHGVLHLLGYDHLAEAAADEMEGLERSILAALAIADPYAQDTDRKENIGPP